MIMTQENNATPVSNVGAMRKALEWYAEQAEAISRHTIIINPTALEAVVTTMSLDAGCRALKALKGSTSPNALPIVKAVCQHCERTTVVPKAVVEAALKDTPPSSSGAAFEGSVDTDTALQAAAREAGWALSELVDGIDWRKRDHVADIIGRLVAALSAPPVSSSGPEFTPTHRHKKRGSTYQVIGLGRLQVDGDLDMEKVTIYQGEDGSWWVRPTYEFNDGRFEALSATATEVRS